MQICIVEQSLVSCTVFFFFTCHLFPLCLFVSLFERWDCEEHASTTNTENMYSGMEKADGTMLGHRPGCSSSIHRDNKQTSIHVYGTRR